MTVAACFRTLENCGDDESSPLVLTAHPHRVTPCAEFEDDDSTARLPKLSSSTNAMEVLDWQHSATAWAAKFKDSEITIHETQQQVQMLQQQVEATAAREVQLQHTLEETQKQLASADTNARQAAEEKLIAAEEKLRGSEITIHETQQQVQMLQQQVEAAAAREVQLQHTLLAFEQLNAQSDGSVTSIHAGVAVSNGQQRSGTNSQSMGFNDRCAGTNCQSMRDQERHPRHTRVATNIEHSNSWELSPRSSKSLAGAIPEAACLIAAEAACDAAPELDAKHAAFALENEAPLDARGNEANLDARGNEALLVIQESEAPLVVQEDNPSFAARENQAAHPIIENEAQILSAFGMHLDDLMGAIQENSDDAVTHATEYLAEYTAQFECIVIADPDTETLREQLTDLVGTTVLADGQLAVRSTILWLLQSMFEKSSISQQQQSVAWLAVSAACVVSKTVTDVSLLLRAASEALRNYPATALLFTVCAVEQCFAVAPEKVRLIDTTAMSSLVSHTAACTDGIRHAITQRVLYCLQRVLASRSSAVPTTWLVSLLKVIDVDHPSASIACSILESCSACLLHQALRASCSQLMKSIYSCLKPEVATALLHALGQHYTEALRQLELGDKRPSISMLRSVSVVKSSPISQLSTCWLRCSPVTIEWNTLSLLAAATSDQFSCAQHPALQSERKPSASWGGFIALAAGLIYPQLQLLSPGLSMPAFDCESLSSANLSCLLGALHAALMMDAERQQASAALLAHGFGFRLAQLVWLVAQPLHCTSSHSTNNSTSSTNTTDTTDTTDSSHHHYHQ